MKNGASITLEDLYQLIVGNQKSNDRQFNSIDQRFDSVDQRLDSVDQRLDLVDQRFDSVDQRFDSMEGRIESMDQKFIKRFDEQDAYLEHSFTAIQQQFVDFQDKLNAITADIDYIKNWFDRQEKINDIEETERLAMGQKIERTIGYCKDLAKEIGYDLKV